MIALTETVLFYQDSLDEYYRERSSGSVKDGHAGVARVQDWINKCAPLLSLPNTLLPQCLTRSSRQVKSLPIGGSAGAGPVFKGPAANTRSTTHRNTTTPMEPNPASKPETQGTIVNVVSSSKLDDRKASPLACPKPESKQPDMPEGVLESANEFGDGKGTHLKRDQRDQSDTGSQLYAPPLKRIRTQHGASRSHRSGSGAKNKYTDVDLPPGATDNNTWRRLFVSWLAYFTAGCPDPWNIPEEHIRIISQVIWDRVYENSIKHTITLGGPVYYVAKQCISIWREGFAAAAVAVIAAFFAKDADFEDAEKRAAFAKAMLLNNRFLFSENRDLDKKNWSGLWRAPFVLRTFAHRFNHVQGGTDAPQLGKDNDRSRTALSLACAAVRRVLTLVSNNNMTFSTSPSGDTWTTIITEGSQYEFNESAWGQMTMRYLEPINALSNEQYKLIINEVRKYVKAGIATSGSVDEAFDDLFLFR